LLQVVIMKCLIKPLHGTHQHGPSADVFHFISVSRCIEEPGWWLATGWMTEEVGGRVPVGSGIFTSPRRLNRLWGRPNNLSNGFLDFSPWVKRPGPEGDHSPPANAEVKKM
jgi:hypothetical protein